MHLSPLHSAKLKGAAKSLLTETHISAETPPSSNFSEVVVGCYSHDNRHGSASLENTLLLWNQQTATEFTKAFPGDKKIIDMYSLRSCGEPGR